MILRCRPGGSHTRLSACSFVAPTSACSGPTCTGTGRASGGNKWDFSKFVSLQWPHWTLHFFVINLNIAMACTRSTGFVRTLQHRFRLFPLGHWLKRGRNADGATYFVVQSKRGRPTSAKWIKGQAVPDDHAHDARPVRDMDDRGHVLQRAAPRAAMRAVGSRIGPRGSCFPPCSIRVVRPVFKASDQNSSGVIDGWTCAARQ